MKKYYFVYYKVYQQSVGNGGTSGHDLYCQVVLDEHPLHFQLDCNEQYDYWRDDGVVGRRVREAYQVISWQELTYDEYLEFKDKIG